MFADSSLAARIDRAEANLTRSIADGIEGALCRPIGGGVASLVRPRSPMNKLIGVGWEGRLDDATLEAVEAEWLARGEPVRAEVSTLAAPELLSQLVDQGYRLTAFENVLGLSLAGREQAAPTGVEVAQTEDFPAWRETTFAGFAHPDGTGAGAEEVPR